MSVCNSLEKQPETKETKTGQAEVTYLLTGVILFSRFSQPLKSAAWVLLVSAPNFCMGGVFSGHKRGPNIRQTPYYHT